MYRSSSLTFSSGNFKTTSIAHAFCVPFTKDMSTPPIYWRLAN